MREWAARGSCVYCHWVPFRVVFLFPGGFLFFLFFATEDTLLHVQASVYVQSQSHMADPGKTTRYSGTLETVERINDARPKFEGEQPLIKRRTSGERTKDRANVEGGRAG